MGLGLPTFFHQVAGAANAAMLVIVVILAALGPALVSPVAHPVESLPPPRGTAQRMVLLVIDALRLDAASDPALMPNLQALAGDGMYGVARVDSAVPSTIAGMTTLVTGQSPGPASFLLDFGAPVASDGGLLRMLDDRGSQTFIAGPQLWLDRYAPWVAAAWPTDRIGDDANVLAAGIAALGSAKYDLVIIHLSRGDEVAHMHGAASAQYRQFVIAADDAVRQVADALPADAALIICSDHGVTDSGGHAGPEDVVRDTPLVGIGPGLPGQPVGTISQSAVPRLIARALDMCWPAESGVHLQSTGIRRVLMGALLPVALLAGGAALTSVPMRSRRRGYAMLNLPLWPALVLLVAMQFAAAALIATGALLHFAWRSRAWCVHWQVMLTFLAGVVFGLLRWWVALRSVESLVVAGLAAGVMILLLIRAMQQRSIVRRDVRRSMGWGMRWTIAGAMAAPVLALPLSGPTLALACVVGGLLGWGVAVSLNRGWVVGWVVLLLAPPVLSRIAGQTLSLSSIDVRHAFPLLDLPGGPGWAVAAVILTQLLPLAALAMPVAATMVGLPRRIGGGLVAALAAAYTGQLTIGAAILAADPASGAGAALAVALIVAALAELLLLTIAACLAATLTALLRGD